MTDLEKEEVSKFNIWKSYPEYKGGQNCGSIRGLTLINYELGIELSSVYFRSQIKNREFLLKCFNTLLDDK